MRVRPSLEDFGTSAVGLSGAIRSQDDRLANKKAPTVLKEIDLVPLAKIKSRKSGDLRPINLAFVVEKLALSIQALGLIEPIVVDQDYDLIAGGHRRFTLELLAQDPQKRPAWVIEQVVAGVAACSPNKAEHYANLAGLLDHVTKLVPVRVVLVNSEDERAVAMEIAENEMRRDFTREEVETMRQTLEERGYAFGGVGGRPKKGETSKSGLPLLAGAFHKSERHIRRILAGPKEERTPISREAKLAHDLKSYLMGECSEEIREWAERGLDLLGGE